MPGQMAPADDDDDGTTAADASTRTGAPTASAGKVSRGEEAEDVDDDDDDDDEAAERRRDEQVQALARQYSQASDVHAHPGKSVFDVGLTDPDSPLNPNSTNFRARAWAKAVVDMVARDGGEFRTTGVCFQNLNVFGFGAGTDYQKDVANVWLEAAGLVRRIFGAGKRRIDILRGFDGVVRKGEMLVVLGPPGAGCSTLLKTIAGETSGIFVDDDSYFNYQGASSVLLSLYPLFFSSFFFWCLPAVSWQRRPLW